MVDSSSADLLDEINDKKRRRRTLPWAVVLSVAGVGVLAAIKVPIWLIVSFGALAVVACRLISMWDALCMTTVILYDLEPEVETAFSNFHNAFASLRSCSRAWHITARAEILDAKYHGGAGGAVRKTQIELSVGDPPKIKTNVVVPLIPVGRQLLAFMPERLLVFEENAVGAVGYDDLCVSITERNVIENEAVPNDATVVGKTWRYVNKDGGPDRRFKNNPTNPICAYTEIHFSSTTGLNEVLIVSRQNAGKEFHVALSALDAVQAGKKPAVT